MEELKVIEPDVIIEAINKDDFEKYELDGATSVLKMEAENAWDGRDNVVKYDGVPYVVKPLAMRQLLKKLGIPLGYWNTIDNEDKAYNFNMRSLKVDKDIVLKCRQVINGKHILRGVLPTQRTPMDNRDMFQHLYEHLQEIGEGKIVGFDLRDDFFDFRVVIGDPVEFGSRLHTNGESDPIYSGLLGSNSEVTTHGMHLDSLMWRLVCTNGMISTVGNKSFINQGYRGFFDDFDADHEEISNAMTGAIEHGQQNLLAFKDRYNHQISDILFEKMVNVLHSKAKVSAGFMEEMMTKLADVEPIKISDFANAATKLAQDLEGQARYLVEKTIGYMMIDCV